MSEAATNPPANLEFSPPCSSSPSYTALLVENAHLRSRLAAFERGDFFSPADAAPKAQENSPYCPEPLSSCSISRYGRQLLVREFGGPASQRALATSRVLIIGAGGLGCPAALFLAGAGLLNLTIVDGDRVERSNLHRQIGHTEARLGEFKAASLLAACRALNGDFAGSCRTEFFSCDNALELCGSHDVVLDCTDNVPTRYLINDAAVICGIPLVSGAALRLDGQLSVYGDGAPCYRCIFPVAPPASSVTACSDGGILGPVTGIIGALQALEAIKIIARRAGAEALTRTPGMILFDGSAGTFRSVKMRGKNQHCAVCGQQPNIDRNSLRPEIYQQTTCSDPVLEAAHSSSDLSVSASFVSCYSGPHLLVDVRDPSQFAICRLPGSENFPINKILQEENRKKLQEKIENQAEAEKEIFHVFLICRRGIDSLRAAQLLNSLPWKRPVVIRNVSGGLLDWRDLVDSEFPLY